MPVHNIKVFSYVRRMKMETCAHVFLILYLASLLEAFNIENIIKVRIYTLHCV